MADNRIGYIGEGGITYPDVTLSGQDYDQPLALHLLTPTTFVILDDTPPRGFDVDAELAKLAPKPKPKAVESKKDES